ncbi:flavin nucleotide-binding protein [Geoanaerobacter pelophilus]|uniref:Flavin nucleotide-binding protein n=1 Tax=Geoanaerobacter pelophilus TaxID=60036 RepID=A0ABQ0MJV5_9BACT|nr:pyridoxamine 5'-phosphate oxidase family protein [Geoanaerobacter pelophilus]GAW67214.1 flavin nucleotide-binding protein [Geoanaerobacter pelophilus]
MRHEIRRKDRQLDQAHAHALLEKGEICHLAMVDHGEPYIVTLNYGYRDSTMYFHCAAAGRKMGILRTGSRVCFTIVPRHELLTAEKACDFSTRYESVVGYGAVRVIEDPEEKLRGLSVIMAQYAAGDFAFPEAVLAKTTVFTVDIEELSGKSNY